MAGTSTPPSEGETWFEASRKYWEAWHGLWQQGLEAASQGTARPEQQWGQAFDQWWHAAAPSSAAPPELVQSLMDQGKLFLRLGEEVAAALLRSGDALRSDPDWQRVFQAAAESWRAGLGSASPDIASLGTAWKLPFDTWSRTLSSASVFPGDFLEQLKPESWTQVTDDMHRHLERFLSVPGLGYTREWQEQGQEFARLGLNYQRALQEYASLFRRLNLDAFDRLQRTLSEAKQPITTLRELYDVWVDCSETAYLDLVSTDAYAETYGQMVNALMALKRHGRNMVDEAAGAMGMPTRHDLNTLQRRQQELRRELVAVRQVASERTGREEIAALRKEVDRLRVELTGEPVARPGGTKRAASRRATRRRRPPSDRGPKAKGG
jgi:class III poly(R)-hydroxyalkanoic acid synthase PhaE subunit